MAKTIISPDLAKKIEEAKKAVNTGLVPFRGDVNDIRPEKPLVLADLEAASVDQLKSLYYIDGKIYPQYICYGTEKGKSAKNGRKYVRALWKPVPDVEAFDFTTA
jgi:hypothetical protein